MYVRLLSILQSTALEGDPVIMPKQLQCLEADSKVAKEPLSSGPRPTPAKGFLGKGYSVKEGGRVKDSAIFSETELVKDPNYNLTVPKGVLVQKTAT